MYKTVCLAVLLSSPLPFLARELEDQSHALFSTDALVPVLVDPVLAGVAEEGGACAGGEVGGLLPRLKNIGSTQLSRPDDTGANYTGLEPVMMRPTRWNLIEQQYDQLVKYATALRLGTTEAEQVLRRFTCGSPNHPTYIALEVLGRAEMLTAGTVSGRHPPQ